MQDFTPDYTNIVKVANNIEVKRIPLYDHLISLEIMETITNKSFADHINGNFEDKKYFFANYSNFFKTFGYDAVSYECCIGPIMPGSGLLGGHGIPPAITTRQDYDNYPWQEIEDLFFDEYALNYKALRETMPVGMKAIGGVGNGVFECVQDIIGFENLCFIQADDPELFADVFKAIGQVSLDIWKRFLVEFGDTYCVLRFGDDLGYKSSTLLQPEVIIKHIIPQYQLIIQEVHKYNKPFLLHSCGDIFSVMDELINVAKIDAKHSNEDVIAPFPVWVDRYGDEIGNFGGIDTDAVCQLNRQDMTEYITKVADLSVGKGGFAFGSGNSIPDYVPVEGFLTMNNIIREYRQNR